jgi:hypothetical protein
MNDFYEEDEPLDELLARFDAAPKVLTGAPYRTLGCEHLTASGPFASLSCAACGPCREVAGTTVCP